MTATIEGLERHTLVSNHKIIVTQKRIKLEHFLIKVLDALQSLLNFPQRYLSKSAQKTFFEILKEFLSFIVFT